MTPLTTKQVLDNVSAPAVLRAQAWAESTTAPDPSMPGSKSSRTWALEAAQSAEDAEDAADTAATNTANAITSAMQGYVSAASGSASAAATSEANAATSAGQAAISAGQAVAAMAGAIRFDQAQSLTSGQKQQARDNMGLGDMATLNLSTVAGEVLSGTGFVGFRSLAASQLGHNQIGSFAFACTSDAQFGPGATTSGVGLRPSGLQADASGESVKVGLGGTGFYAGTWRCLGFSPGILGSREGVTLWQRIS